MFPSLWREGLTVLKEGVRRRKWGSAQPNRPLMLFCMRLLGFVFLVLGAVLTGVSNYLERYMHTFFLFTPLWLLWLVTRCDSAAQPKSIGIVLLAATLAVVPVRAVNLAWALEPDCVSCRLAVPYEGLAAKLKSMGFATGTRSWPWTATMGVICADFSVKHGSSYSDGHTWLRPCGRRTCTLLL